MAGVRPGRSAALTRDLRVLRYALPGGWSALAGRSDADNDRLSTKVARPGDWWFHVRGGPGSHVVLQGPEGAEPDRATLRAAAAIAAWHSRARAGGEVAVSCTEARHVRKPRGAKPGTVEIRHEIVLKVRPALPPPAAEAPAGLAEPGAPPPAPGRETPGDTAP